MRTQVTHHHFVNRHSVLGQYNPDSRHNYLLFHSGYLLKWFHSWMELNTAVNELIMQLLGERK